MDEILKNFRSRHPGLSQASLDDNYVILPIFDQIVDNLATEYVSPITVDEIFQDFRGRRFGLLTALTIDAQQLSQKVSGRLFGIPNGTWEVNDDSQLSDQPLKGIIFANTAGMRRQDRLALVANRSDSWLLSLARYFAARAHLNHNERTHLFDLINNLPTLSQIISQEEIQARVGCQILPQMLLLNEFPSLRFIYSWWRLEKTGCIEYPSSVVARTLGYTPTECDLGCPLLLEARQLFRSGLFLGSAIQVCKTLPVVQQQESPIPSDQQSPTSL